MDQCLTLLRACQGAPRNLWCTERISKTYLLTIIFLLSSCIAVAQAQTSTGTKMGFSAHAVVNFAELARKEKLHPVAMQQQQAIAVPEMRHVNLPVPAGAAPMHLPNRAKTNATGTNAAVGISFVSGNVVASVNWSSPSIFSPVAGFSYAGTADNTLRIPPAPSAAVSATYLVETVNGTFSVQNRAGGVIQTVFMDTFWASVGGVSGVVNARVVYDPYNSRWIMAAEWNGNTVNSVLLIGVSTSSNPTSTWNLFKVNSDLNSSTNFPTLGFNANWIAVSMNMYQINCTTNCFQKENVYVFNKAQLYANTLGTVSKFTDTSGAGTYMPAVTFDNNAATPLYLLEKWNENSNGFGYLRIGSITGSVSVPNVNFQVSFVAFGNPWAFTGGVFHVGFSPHPASSLPHPSPAVSIRSLTYP